MNISWYPWQLFIRKKEVVLPIGIVLIGVLGLGIWLEVALQRVPQPVFLHYSVELGVDALGNAHTALLLPAFVFTVLLINTLIANVLMLSQKAAALLILWSTVPLAAIAIWFGALILHVNGA